MNSVIPKYCVNQDPKSKCMQEMLSSYNSDNDCCDEGKTLSEEIKVDLEYLLNFNIVKLISTTDTDKTAYTFEDENGIVILSGRGNSLDNDFINLANNIGKGILRIEYSGERAKDLGAPMQPDSKREEFRRYLDKAGVMDALTRVLVSLYEEPEKPTNAIEYFLDHLANGIPMKSELDAINGEIDELKRKISELQADNEKLRSRLEQYEPVTPEVSAPNPSAEPTTAPAPTEPEAED